MGTKIEWVLLKDGLEVARQEVGIKEDQCEAFRQTLQRVTGEFREMIGLPYYQDGGAAPAHD